ncbi:MAG: hypothetical protein WCF20_02750 [Methylovirgula sp.]
MKPYFGVDGRDKPGHDDCGKLFAHGRIFLAVAYAISASIILGPSA